ncbi:Phosphatidylinositol-4-phosphate 5-kinase its3 [Termitomyces sp. J132]|nr:Phosphatidylinositol-4-phosphate 5-kinase its3 [Termitomyces sp. J132]
MAPSSMQTATSPNTTSFQRSQEIRILTVSDEAVRVEKTVMASQDSYIARVMAGPLPPSPPASVVDEESVIYAEPESISILQTSTEPPTPPSLEPSTSPPQPVHRSSTDTKASWTVQPAGQSTLLPSAYLPSPPSTSFAKSATHLASDSHLPPPPSPMARERPVRRNTIGSAPKQPFPVGVSGGELEEDIQLYEENIRRERRSKRAKVALTRSHEEETVTVGNIIGEGHVNYVLMYNMLTGIRIGVSRCQAKIKRPLTPDDFQAKHKYSFDIIGNELTPSAKYDFKFKDYAPCVFRSLREDYFHLDPADYLLSLTSKYILSELGSPGKSGSFFYFSRDYRFIIKTIHHAEHLYLLRILPEYYEHVKANPHTLLSRFYGLHRVKLPRGRKIHFVIMNNIFPPHRDIHETYDLKGSTVGREYPEGKAEQNPRAVLKDLNWINRGRVLELGPEKRALLAEQLRRDAAFLRQVNVMDYSLLVGIHNMQRGNRDNVRRNTLKVFSPPPPSSTAQDFSVTEVTSSLVQRERASSSQSRSLSFSSSHPPVACSSSYQAHPYRRERDSHRDKGKDREKELADHFVDRQHFMFYQDEGGLRATDETNFDMDVIYYVGVIDILTPYGGKKKLEHFWKGLRADRHKISPVPPSEYADRFLAFMKAIMRGGEGGARFKVE